MSILSEDDIRQIKIPPNRSAYVRQNWDKIVDPVIRHLKLDIMFDPKQKRILIRKNASTDNPNAITKALDFINAINFGFEIGDSLSLVRLDDIFLLNFDVTDIKTLNGDNLSRAVGRIAGKGGKIKYEIENSTHTRISLMDTRVAIIGQINNVKMAQRTICDLVMGSPANKIHAKLRGYQRKNRY